MNDKKYKSIKEVSKLLDINMHVIRYWDSKFNDISTRLNQNNQRFFSNDNIKKLKELKLTLYNNGKHNYSLDLAKKIIDNKNKNSPLDTHKNFSSRHKKLDINSLKTINQNLKKILDI